MNSLLIGGAQNTGKSQAIYRIANTLQSKGFKVIAGTIPATFSDFKVILKGIDNNGKDIIVIINSATDTEDIIKAFKKFFDSNGVYHILISSVRDEDYYPRKDFFKIMELNSQDDFILEIPFAKITRIKKYRAKPLKWFADNMDNLMNHILRNNPFNIG
ncbi:hypothetical protein PXD56_02535 [Maribacter sp. SA7]|uniref:hypothetical protein n=1 Tax=Maribacter zhoushanensis TaxID=3030012 RepID=UPI0023EBA417|nr:hypothetical protein [Maribacter zhoushanensis]MDF4201814.1 hypothetical protein [Maribacter zhoushanensis]